MATIHELATRRSEDTLIVRLGGSWRLSASLPSAEQLASEFRPPVRRVAFEAGEIEAWDSGLLTFLTGVLERCARAGITVDRSGLPEGVRRLLDLATAVPERQGARRGEHRLTLLARIGQPVLDQLGSWSDNVEFLGHAILSLGRFVRGRARFRKSDFGVVIQETGANALAIVSLINFLIGAILAFVGAVQLQQFGAQIYVANLVAIGVTREMGAMMTGIIMAGRTGAAFAAQLGTMTVNEEIDALKTMGFSDMDFLVLPRMLALCLMMPLLTIYADLLGILGGAVVGVTMLDLPIVQYLNQTQGAVGLDDFFAGLIKGAIFGILVAIAGCYQGIRCGRSASAVGDAATAAVVSGILYIIVSDSILTVIYSVTGF